LTRVNERLARAQEAPLVGSLPDVPGIGVAMRLTPGLGVHLRGLADELLVNDYPGATVTRAEREIIATAVSPLPITAVRKGTSRLVSAEFPMPPAPEVKAGDAQSTDQQLAALRDEVKTLREELRKLREEMAKQPKGSEVPHP